MSSSKETLKSLHTMLCEELVRRLASGDDCPPAILNVIRQFLRDNHIDGVAEDGNALNQLLDGLPAEFKEKYNTESKNAL